MGFIQLSRDETGMNMTGTFRALFRLIQDFFEKVTSRSWSLWLFFLAVSFLFISAESVVTSPFYKLPTWPSDSVTFMLMGKVLLEGKVPYVDLFDHKGPVLYVFQAVGQLIYPGRFGVYAVQILMLSFSMTLLWKAGCLIAGKGKNLCAMALFLLTAMWTFENGNQCEEYSLPFGILCIYLALKHLKKTGEGDLELPLSASYLFGICLAASAMIRAIDAVVPAAVILGMALFLLKKKQYYNLCFHCVTGFLGMTTVLLPILFYFSWHGALHQMYDAMITFNMQYAAYYSRFRLDAFNPLTGCKLMLLFCLVLPFLSAGMPNRIGWVLVPVALLPLPVLIKQNDYLHYYTLLLPVVYMTYAVLLLKISEKGGARRYAYIALGGLLLATPLRQDYLKRRNLVMLNNLYFPASYKTVEAMITRIPEKERNRFWSINTWEDDWLYIEWNMRSAVRYAGCLTLVHLGVRPEIEKEIIQTLESDERAPLWILVRPPVQPGIMKSIQANYDMYRFDPDTTAGYAPFYKGLGLFKRKTERRAPAGQ